VSSRWRRLGRDVLTGGRTTVARLWAAPPAAPSPRPRHWTRRGVFDDAFLPADEREPLVMWTLACRQAAAAHWRARRAWHDPALRAALRATRRCRRAARRYLPRWRASLTQTDSIAMTGHMVLTAAFCSVLLLFPSAPAFGRGMALMFWSVPVLFAADWLPMLWSALGPPGWSPARRLAWLTSWPSGRR
jgi:hypothetical protein